MKQSVAIQHLRNLMIVAQRFKSISTEELERAFGDKEAVASTLNYLHPWLYDEKKSIIIGLTKLLTLVDQGHPLAPMDFYNMMFVVDRFLPHLNSIAPTMRVPEFPEPQILLEWEKE